jgi:hypothetical protein
MKTFSEWLETFDQDAQFSVQLRKQLMAGGYQPGFHGEEYAQKDIIRMLGNNREMFQQAVDNGAIRQTRKPGYFTLHFYNTNPYGFKQDHINRRRAEMKEKYPHAQVPANAQSIHNIAANAGQGGNDQYTQALGQYGFQGPTARDDAFKWVGKMRDAGHTTHR